MPFDRLYLLVDGGKGDAKEFVLNDFIPFNRIVEDFDGLNVITMDEFLKRKGITGQLKNTTDGQVLMPPENRTNFDHMKLKPLWNYMRSVGVYPKGWEDTTKCFAAIPSRKGKQASDELQKAFDDIVAAGPLPNPLVDFRDEPAPVDGSVTQRMREMIAGRPNICIYDSQLQDEVLLHFRVEVGDARLLTHFYSFLFYQDWVSATESCLCKCNDVDFDNSLKTYPDCTEARSLEQTIYSRSFPICR
jgi:hypothetical protein